MATKEQNRFYYQKNKAMKALCKVANNITSNMESETLSGQRINVILDYAIEEIRNVKFKQWS
jgi:hypothetical protein